MTHSSDRVMAVVSGLTKPEYGIRHNTLRDVQGQSQKPFMQTLLRTMKVLDERETFGEGNGPDDDIDLSS